MTGFWTRPISWHGALVAANVIAAGVLVLLAALGWIAGTGLVGWYQVGVAIWVASFLVLSPHSRKAFWVPTPRGSATLDASSKN